MLCLGVGKMWGASRTYDGNEVLYIKNIGVSDKANWKISGGNIRAYFYNNSSNRYSDNAEFMYGTENGVNAIYAFTVPAGTWDHVIILRGDGTPNFDSKWNQTGNIELHATANYIDGGYAENATTATWSTLSKNLAQGSTLFVKTNSSWAADAALFEAYFYDGHYTQWVSFTASGVDNYQRLTVPERDWPFVIICRMDPSGTAHSWNGKWNQTNNIQFPSSKNCVVLSSGTTDGSVSFENYTTPSVSLTSATAISTSQITLVGRVDDFGGYASNAAGMVEVGFYVNGTKYTAHSTDGATFTKTVSGLTAGTTYSVKAFATNVFATAETETSSVTTRSTGNYPINVRVAHDAAAPKIYAWTDGSTYGGVKQENAAYASRPSLTKTITGTTYDWYQYSMSNDYSTFSLDNGSDGYKVDNLSAPLEEKCYYYNYTGSGEVGTMECPSLTTQLVIKKDVAVSDTRVDMAGSDPITLNYNLDANSTYKVKILYGAEYYGKNSSTLNRETATSSNTISGMVVEQEYITLNTDFAGTYSFSFDPDDKSLVVGYPSAHTVTYGVGTVAGCASVTPTPNFSSGALQLDATSITFAKSATISGYTWKGWYDNAAGNGDAISTTDGSYTSSSRAADYSIYACYTENNYTVSVVSSSATAGSVASPSVTGHVTTSAALPTATPNTGYYFVNWEVTSGTASITNENNASGATINGMTGDCTVRAKFAPIWALTGNTDELGNWSSTANEIEHITTAGDPAKTSGYVEVTLYPNRDYNFRIRDNQHDNGANNEYRYSVSGDMLYTNCTNWQLYNNQGTNSNIKTAGYGTYRFTWNITDKQLTVTYPASSVLTLGWGYAQIDDLATVKSGNTGGSVTARTNEGGGDGFAITNSQYFANGSNITFTAAPATGYTVEWYNNSDYAVEHKITNNGNYAIAGNTLTVSSISADLAIYAKFVETSTAVTFAHNEHGHVKIGGGTVTNTTVGVTTERTITAVPEDGWYFAGWTVPDGADFNVANADGADDSYSKSTTLSGIGAGTAGTITANFVEEEKIYFRNVNESTGEKLMSDVYVYFGIWWDKGNGDVAKTNNGDNMYEHMTEIGNTKVYWAHIPHAFTIGRGANIAFAQNEFSGNGVAMDNSIVSSRGDYNSALNMFVPYRTVKSTKNNTKYYDDGYWKIYGNAAGEKAGYKILRYTGSGYENPASKGDEEDYEFVVIDENTIEYELRIDNTTSGWNKFKIYTDGNTSYTTADGDVTPSGDGYTITTTNCNRDDITLKDYATNSNPRFEITATADGIYTLTIDQSSDVMTIKVNYPVAVGDYRIKHTYNDGSAHTTYSDIIKASKAGETSTVSMYLNTAITSELYLQKCTSISGSTITWSDGSDYWSTCRGKFKDGNGVYQFDVKIEDGTPSTISSLDNAGLYTGNFYIKTDCADGGWTAYKSNILEKNTINFDRAKSNTFDYYFCKWIGDARKNENSETDRVYPSGGQPTNVKFVIANDYNNAVSDTIETDAVISDGKSYQTLKWPANVRFSYNSATNEAKRTYLNGSGNYHGEYLYLEGLDSKVDMDEETDGVQATAKLTDRNNWTYYIDIKAKEGARVRLSAKYGTTANGIIQDMIGSRNAGTIGTSNTVEILGTSEPVDGTNWHDLRIIYDFKTNHLMSAWLVRDNQTVAETKVINTNVMILRQDQGDAKQISIGTGVSLSSVDTIYTALSFTKAHLTGTSGASEYARKYYWVSFPYDVKINDIFGSMGTYAVDWVLREYDGQGRAQNGYWAESASNWKFITDKNKTLQAYQGYLLQLSLPRYAAGNSKWDNSVTELSLYFPSKTKVGSIVQKNVNATLGTGNAEDYKCSIDWSGNPNGNGGTLGSAYNRTLRDSYWHCIGTPSFANETNASFKLHDGEIEGEGTWTTDNLPFLYVWNSSDNSLTPTSSSAGDFKFKALQAYLVQCNANAISWSNVSVPNSVVARRKATVEDIHFAEFKLDLMNGEKSLDHTYIRLTDKEEVTAGFEFGQDLCKEFKSGANIYTLIDQQEVAGNSLPMSEQTTVVPVGVKITTDGEYTFAMPEGSNGTGAVLVDNIAGTRTNLGLTDYTVTLGKGTYDGRFVLELSPVAQTPTGIGEVASDQVSSTKARKVLIDGIMYIVRDGEVFDARGTKVK